MVYYFESEVNGIKNTIYMGKDKHENEDLIKHGWDEDVWFHVDNLSSAHVYLRMNKGQTWDNLPNELLTDLAQLTKANSIQGNKQNNITIIYTPWNNLLKRGNMDVGQVGFKNDRLVKKVFVETRVNAIVNRLNKTKVEKYPDFFRMKVEHNKSIMRDKKAELRKKEEEQRKSYGSKEAETPKGYDSVFKKSNMSSNRRVKNDIFDDDSDDDNGPNPHADDFSDFI